MKEGTCGPLFQLISDGKTKVVQFYFIANCRHIGVFLIEVNEQRPRVTSTEKNIYVAQTFGKFFAPCLRFDVFLTTTDS